MRWKQFLTPVKAINAQQAHELKEKKPFKELTILDVRQPEEYEIEHLPGAKLIPLPELTQRLGELDQKKEFIVYCAIGGRSRVAAQMLSGNGFEKVNNLSGGIKAWNRETAKGTETFGLDLFTGKESHDQSLIIAYSLEQGLQDFYIKMVQQMDNPKGKKLFEKLADVEIKHQKRIFDEYLGITGKKITQEEFEKDILQGIIEGGLSTEEYMNLFTTNQDSLTEIVSIAMSIEAQALDLYQRASEKSRNPQSKVFFNQLASEEQTHLKWLGEMMQWVNLSRDV